ncbi:MAG: hypothetical protein DYG94_11700 [Leptolyngbya sp. PLA3]|nr:MAG: hypothetical protein EDM82_13050 [Cyanobacteria bacterium CYA]MCE7969388.1 hypothetical protein [Leptolyngbya sp. PL-A3]
MKKSRTISVWLWLGALLWVALLGTRSILERSLVGHAVLQVGLLVLSGWCIGRWLNAALGRSRAGEAGLVLAAFTLAVWMLPRSLDAALRDASWEIAKFVSVPLLVGVPVARAWAHLPTIVRGLLWANILSMLITLGWVYWTAPTRLCNNYLLTDQPLLAKAFWGLAALVAIVLLVRITVAPRVCTQHRADAASESSLTCIKRV